MNGNIVKKKKPKITKCYTSRLTNRRVTVGKWDNGDYAIEYKRLTEKKEVVVTRFSLSKEAMEATVALFYVLDDDTLKFKQGDIAKGTVQGKVTIQVNRK